MLVAMVAAAAQKPKTVEFSPDALPDALLEQMNSQTQDGDRRKENEKSVKALRAVYGKMGEGTQERVAALFTYAVKAKLKGNPDLRAMADAVTAYAADANLEGWLQAAELLKKRAAKAKALNEWVDFSLGLQQERLLYRSNSCQWNFAAGTPFRIVVEDGMVEVLFDSPADLRYASAKDAYVIHSTTGRFDYKNLLWHGRGGRIDWSRTGLVGEACWADLASYDAEVKFPKFAADSVLFTNTHYFSTPIAGRVEDALSSQMEPDKYAYPRFRSYQRDFEIRDILPDVDYSGSFMMNGNKFITANTKHPAQLVFRRGGKPQLRVTSQKFTITADRAVGENAEVALYLGADDSISNTGVTVRYLPARRTAHIINDAKRNFYSPFVDSYHELDIYCEEINWQADNNTVEFGNLGSSGTASMVEMESSNYYTYRKYREIQGIDAVSPVRRVYEYAEANSYGFSAKSFSNSIGLDMSQTLLMIHNLSKHGLVQYNERTGMVAVKEKLEDYVKAFGKSKGFDYDAITLQSSTRGTNARMSLDSNRIEMLGVSQLVVSDSQQVKVYPRGGRVSVGKNRNLRFSGRIDVGKFIMYVTDCDFSYERFGFDMPHVDSVFFYVPEFGNPDSAHIVYTPLYNLVGTLSVDQPDNHCGLVKNKAYPIFESRENSYVYYDKANIQQGQYAKERFYYTLHPFTIQSLVDFKTDDLQFNGVLTSAGIFPDIAEPLKVQRDYYLGFQVETPAGGYPAYGGKGHYSHQIRLDHNGLRGTGELTYLASRSTSKDYLFLPDSMLTTADTFCVKQEQGFPDIRNGRVAQRWMPYADSMSVASLKQGRPFRMYQDDATLRGRVTLQPKGASASGTATVKDGTLASSLFVLAPRQMDAAVTEFTLRSTTFGSVAFSAKGVTSSVDFDKRQGHFGTVGGPVRTELQMVQYEAWADRFDWEMDRKELALLNSQRPNSEGLSQMDLAERAKRVDDMPGVRFRSTDAAQQGLAWNALRPVYRYDLGDLSAEGVYAVAVGDAAIAPNADTLHISKGGQMRVLNQASLVCDREHAWHRIFDADLIVGGARTLSGKGYIDYVDDTRKPQRLFLNKVEVDGRGVTVAEGEVASEAQFRLSSAFGFAGKVKVEGNQRWLRFEGGVRLVQPCIPAEQLGLLAYADYTDPEHVHVVVPELPTDWKGHRLTASILMSAKSLQPHAAFLTNEKAADNELLSAHGVLTYLGDKKQYMIGSVEKVSDPDGVVEPYLALSTDGCTVEGEGTVDLTLKRTQATFYGYGTAEVGIRDPQNDYLNTVFGVGFPIDKGLVESMAQNIKDDLRPQSMAGSTNAEMRHALMHELGKDKGAAAYALFSATGKMEKLPDAMKQTLLFDNIRWQYLPAMGLFYEGKAGLVAVGDKVVATEVKVKAQVYVRNGSQQMVFYVQVAADHWYFFRYDLGSQELTLYSSVGTWEDQVKSIPLDQRKIAKEGLGTFRYFVGNNSSEVKAYLNWFEKTAHPDDGF